MSTVQVKTPLTAHAAAKALLDSAWQSAAGAEHVMQTSQQMNKREQGRHHARQCMAERNKCETAHKLSVNA
jgi:hypothetical protein